ncbi:MAG: hypothetical protein BGO43_05765 [Gammaproteobacteria bacterium 39-13]|nr:hypothetical protein [Gammaproteobacteria bacterium]OJV91545.1 MAG: hypothetical protein BGO43_05765 [Gammaproteobacteria bacterium 39-13]
MSRWKEILDGFKSILSTQEIEQQRKKASPENTPENNPNTAKQNDLSKKILYLMSRNTKGGSSISGDKSNQADIPKGPTKPKSP